MVSQAKRAALTAKGLSTVQTFDLLRDQLLPALLLPYMRIACSSTAASLQSVRLEPNAPPVDAELELVVHCQLVAHFKRRLAAYSHPIWRDLQIIADPASTPRQRIAARLTKIEKGILQACIDHLNKQAAPLAGGSIDGLCVGEKAEKQLVGAQTQSIKIV